MERTITDVQLPLQTARLTLRPYVESDLDALFSIRSLAQTVRYLYDEPETREQCVTRLAEHPCRTGPGVDVALSLAMVPNGESQMIGDMALWCASAEHRQGELGFVLHPDHQGKGYATEAGLALLHVGFEQVGFHRIVGRLDARNTASSAVLTRLGMRHEALLRENEFVKGEWCDEAVYAMLASEWATR